MNLDPPPDWIQIRQPVLEVLIRFYGLSQAEVKLGTYYVRSDGVKTAFRSNCGVYHANPQLLERMQPT